MFRSVFITTYLESRVENEYPTGQVYSLLAGKCGNTTRKWKRFLQSYGIGQSLRQYSYPVSGVSGK